MAPTDARLATLHFCSRCGAALTTRLVEGRERPACSHCGMVVFLDPKVACATLIEHNGQVLLVKRRNNPGRGLWCLPCGFEEADEPPEAAARREAKEETGLDVTLNGLHGLYHYTDDPRGPGVLVVYHASCTDDIQPRAGDDASDAQFFSADALPPISHHTHQAALDDWKKQ